MTATLETTAQTWKLDASHSSIEFAAKHMMFTTVNGRFAEVVGTIDTNGDAPDSAAVRVTLKSASIDTRSDQRDGHLRSADFLDVENFPKLTFTSTKIAGTKDRFTITGDLTIRGTTKSVTLDATYEGAGINPWGGERLGFSADTKIDRREFGLTWNQALEAGGILVSNEIRIHIEAQLVRA